MTYTQYALLGGGIVFVAIALWYGNSNAPQIQTEPIKDGKSMESYGTPEGAVFPVSEERGREENKIGEHKEGKYKIDYQEITENGTPEELWMHVSSAVRKEDRKLLAGLAPYLEDALQNEEGNWHIYKSMQDMIIEEGMSEFQKRMLLSIIGNLKTKEGVQVLLEISEETENKKIKGAIWKEIRSAGEALPDGGHREEISPLLEAAWEEEKYAEIHGVIAETIARIEAPSGIRKLIETIEGATEEETYRVAMAQYAISQQTDPYGNDELREILKSYLLEEKTSEQGKKASGYALSNAGDWESTKVLIDWASEAPAEAEGIVEEWMERADQAGAFEYVGDIKKYLKKKRFREEEIKEVIEEILVTRNEED